MRLMLNQIREKCRDFQTTLSQIKKSNKSDVLSFLDEMLGPLIKPRKAGMPEPPEPSSRIQTIQKSSKIVSEDGNYFTELNFDLGLVDEADLDAIDFNLALTCAVLSDDTQTTDHNLKIEMGYYESSETDTVEPGELKGCNAKKT